MLFRSRTQENLGSADGVIVSMRKRLVEAARKLEQGGEPPGLHAADYRYRGISLEMPRERTDWQNAILPYMDPRPDTFVESI